MFQKEGNGARGQTDPTDSVPKAAPQGNLPSAKVRDWLDIDVY